MEAWRDGGMAPTSDLPCHDGRHASCLVRRGIRAKKPFTMSCWMMVGACLGLLSCWEAHGEGDTEGMVVRAHWGCRTMNVDRECMASGAGHSSTAEDGPSAHMRLPVESIRRRPLQRGFRLRPTWKPRSSGSHGLPAPEHRPPSPSRHRNLTQATRANRPMSSSMSPSADPSNAWLTGQG